MNKQLPIIGRIAGFVLIIALLGGCATAPQRPPVSNPPTAIPLQPAEITARPVIAFALGGGAARGFAHVGVLNALEANGIHADIVVGTSAGSVVGALYAGGIRGEKLVEAAQNLEREAVMDWMFPNRGIFRGEGLQDVINTLLTDRPIEALDIVFVAVATELSTGREAAFNHGNTGMAVRASSTIPGIVPPLDIDGREYVDGGLVSQVPVRIARELGADIVIAVDVSRQPEQHHAFDSMLSVLRQAMAIMSRAIADTETILADIVIKPEIGDILPAEFSARDQAIMAGEQAGLEAVPLIHELLHRWEVEREVLLPPVPATGPNR